MFKENMSFADVYLQMGNVYNKPLSPSNCACPKLKSLSAYLL